MISPKQAVALGSIVASAALAILKLAVGLLTGSLGILSEAAHSALDLGATLLTYFAVRISGQPADADHPYGHGKVENIAALAETMLLFLTSLGIIYAALGRLLSGGAAIAPSWSGGAVMAFSIVLDFFRSRALGKVARDTGSPALEADALHFRSDMYSSAVVILGLISVRAGYPLGDPIAALGVACFVMLAGYRLGRETVLTLIDTAPAGIGEIVRDAARAVSGVVRVERVRGGPRGSVISVDVEVSVARTLPLERVAEIKTAVIAAIRARLPDAEIMVEISPLALDEETVADRINVIAAAQGVPVHHITVQRLEQMVSVSFDIEIDGEASILEAHETASRLEQAIRDELGAGVEVESHIEPKAVAPVLASSLMGAAGADIAHRIEALASEQPELIDAHDIRVRETGQGLYITLHCHVLPTRTVEAVHDAASLLEQRIREAIPGARRIIVHTEPAEA